MLENLSEVISLINKFFVIDIKIEVENMAYFISFYASLYDGLTLNLKSKKSLDINIVTTKPFTLE